MSKSGDLKGRAEDASLVVAASGGGSMVGDEWLTLLDVGSLIRAIDAKISAFMTKHFKDVAAAKVKPLSDESIINGLYQIVRDDFNAFKFGMDISDDTEPEKKKLLENIARVNTLLEGEEYPDEETFSNQGDFPIRIGNEIKYIDTSGVQKSIFVLSESKRLLEASNGLSYRQTTGNLRLVSSVNSQFEVAIKDYIKEEMALVRHAAGHAARHAVVPDLSTGEGGSKFRVDKVVLASRKMKHERDGMASEELRGGGSARHEFDRKTRGQAGSPEDLVGLSSIPRRLYIPESAAAVQSAKGSLVTTPDTSAANLARLNLKWSQMMAEACLDPRNRVLSKHDPRAEGTALPAEDNALSSPLSKERGVRSSAAAAGESIFSKEIGELRSQSKDVRPPRHSSKVGVDVDSDGAGLDRARHAKSNSWRLADLSAEVSSASLVSELDSVSAAGGRTAVEMARRAAAPRRSGERNVASASRDASHLESLLSRRSQSRMEDLTRS